MNVYVIELNLVSFRWEFLIYNTVFVLQRRMDYYIEWHSCFGVLIVHFRINHVAICALNHIKTH